MLNERVSQFLSINVTGRVFMLCTNEGVKNTAQIRRYEKEVRNILEQKALQGADLDELEPLMQVELENLRRRIRGEEVESPPEIQKPKPVKSQPLPVQEKAEVKKPAKAAKPAAGYKPSSAALHEKLEIKRKPLSELLQKDCVHAKLLTPNRAEYWAHNLTGRLVNEVEADIVSELARNLHENLIAYMRKNLETHPWKTPLQQDQLRADIHAVRTVKGILEVCSQINREIQKAENSQQKGFLQKLMKKLF
jgi:hypothetical protein